MVPWLKTWNSQNPEKLVAVDPSAILFNFLWVQWEILCFPSRQVKLQRSSQIAIKKRAIHSNLPDHHRWARFTAESGFAGGMICSYSRSPDSTLDGMKSTNQPHEQSLCSWLKQRPGEFGLSRSRCPLIAITVLGRRKPILKRGGWGVGGRGGGEHVQSKCEAKWSR